jgi:hypothetical protein
VNAETLISVLLRSKCSDEEIVAFIPLLAKQTGLKLEPATSAALFTRIGELIGGKPTDTDDALKKKLTTYYRDHPPPRALVKALTQYLDQESGRATADGFEVVAKQARAEDRYSFNKPREKKR